jgi:histidinol-phosphate aminotransferase
MKKKEFLVDLAEYVPGKSIEEVAEEFHLNPRKVIKLASNENPFGPSPQALKVLKANIKDVALFPDPVSIRELKETISGEVNVPTKNIVLGAGSDGVFDTLSKVLIDKGDNAIIPIPTFSMYEFVTRVAGARPLFVRRNKDFSVPIERVLSFVDKRTKLIFLCSPNNPTGNLIPLKDIEQVLRNAPGYVLVDEAYIEYAKPGSSALPLFKKYKNLIISRTFSKVYGLANLRIGYAVVSEELARDYEKTNFPFFTSSLGVKAAKAAMEATTYTQRIIRINRQGVEYLEKKIKFRAYPSHSNFVLIDITPFKAKDIVFELQKQGIILRNASSFGPNMEACIRVSVGTMEQNKKMVRALNEFFE